MHIMAAAFPLQPRPEEKKAFFQFLAALRHLLPCEGCRMEYARLTTAGPLKLTPSVVRDRMTLFAWTVRLHNAVNARTRKPVDEDVGRWYRKYDRLRG